MTKGPPTQGRWFDGGELVLADFSQLLRDYNHFENWLGKTGCFGGMYGCFRCFEGVKNGHRWVTKGPPTQTRWFDGEELHFGRF